MIFNYSYILVLLFYKQILLMGNKHSQQEKKVIVVEPIGIRASGNQISTVQINDSTVTVAVKQLQVQAAPQSSLSFKSFIQSINQSFLKVGPWIHQQKIHCENSQLSKMMRQTRQKFVTEVQSPLCNLYNTIPVKFTQAKFQLISPYSYKERFAVLNIICALTAIGTITTTSNINPFTRILRTTRNAALMYMFAGLLIAPEIYNPFIRSS